MANKISGTAFGALMFFLHCTFPAAAQSQSGATAASAQQPAQNSGVAADVKNASSCWGFDIGLSCGLGASFNMNLSATSVTGTKVVAVTGGHVVQSTSSYNNIAGLIAYITLPFASVEQPSGTGPLLGATGYDLVRCGVFAWFKGKCDPFLAFTVPGTTGGIQQYALGWKTQVFPYTLGDKQKHVAIGIGAAFSSEVPIMNSTYVDSTGMVLPAYDSAIANGTLSPTRTADRWGILFMLSTDLD